MGCYRPVRALQPYPGARLRLWPPPSQANTEVRCGKCVGCRTDFAQHWKHRALHEARQHPDNRFATFTYDDKHLPPHGGLDPMHLRDFWKRLRVAVVRHPDRFRSGLVRYLACGEYGERTHRPHYHACMFGFAVKDEARYSDDLFSSDTLKEIWGHGNVLLGHFSPATAAYVAGYTVKQLGQILCDPDGVVLPRPFLRASRNPAIGLSWLREYARDLQHGYLVEEGAKAQIPRYYLTKLQTLNPDLRERIMEKRRLNATQNESDAKQPARLNAAEKIHLARNARNSALGLRPTL